VFAIGVEGVIGGLIDSGYLEHSPPPVLVLDEHPHESGPGKTTFPVSFFRMFTNASAMVWGEPSVCFTF